MEKGLELKNRRIALYGLGTETERFINMHSKEVNIVGLLDGYKESHPNNCPTIFQQGL